MTKINGMYVFFGLFVVVIIGLWVTGNLFKSSNKLLEYTTTEINDFLKTKQQDGGKRKRKLRRKPRR